MRPGIRRAGALDARDLADLFTTIAPRTTTPETLKSEISASGSAWFVAESPDGALLGAQWVVPHADLPPESCEIATIIHPEQDTIAIGSALFAATSTRARHLGYRAIVAIVPEDSPGNLAYYQSRGFEHWGTTRRADAPHLISRYAL